MIRAMTYGSGGVPSQVVDKLNWAREHLRRLAVAVQEWASSECSAEREISRAGIEHVYYLRQRTDQTDP